RVASSCWASTDFDSHPRAIGLPDQIELRLPAIDPVPASGCQRRVLFERKNDQLVVPFGHLLANVQLDRVPRVGTKDVVATHGDSGLVVSHANWRTGSVSMVADRVTVDRRHQPFGFRLRESSGQRLIARGADGRK